MVQLRHRHRRDEALIPCATSHRVPSWPGRDGGDDSISFADIRRMPEPEWAGRSQQASYERGRYEVDALVPAGQLAVVPLPAGPVPVPVAVPRPLPSRDLIERCAAVSTALHADDERHLDTMRVLGEISAAWAAATDTHALRMALAPIQAQLLGVEL